MTLRLPSFLVVGAQKAGTSYLARELGAHPAIFVPRSGSSLKELHFFDRDANYDRGLSYYARHFESAGADLLCGEATANYLYSHRALERIGRDLTETKCVAVLRAPLDRAYSQYWMERRYSGLAMDFASALEARPEFIMRGMYSSQLEQLFAAVGRARCQVLFYENLVADPAGFVGEVCAFLDVHAPTHVRTEVAFRGLGPPPAARVRLIRLGQAGVRRLRSILPAGTAAEERLHRIGKKIRTTVGGGGTGQHGYPPLSPDIRANLSSIFAADIRKTAVLLGGVPASWASSEDFHAGA